ncbi:LysR family transcriptional regulator [Roseateles amylovorans]|uniref:LysR family transcriptional regulator n=1 Tax=Roseateles amylovorans TaxID=2978473 RepID=A0ABY6B4E5_9BURK|nr:LysR family transcriptional regulator [Roseateles amylovorans]UXH79601.1 LysR family transcriptional regulator [Roseateles amylovorans]
MDLGRLDLNLLVTLEALLTEQNVTRAAARLHLSQPAVSAQLSRLRDAFEDPLLLPAQRGMTPTAKALAMLDPLRQALDQVRNAVTSQLDFDPSRADLTVNIACSDYMQVAVLQPLVLRWRSVAPGIRVAVRQFDPARLEAQMASGEIDLGFLTPTEATPGVRIRHLFHERYVMIARRRHRLLKERVTLRDFARLEHVVVSTEGGGFTTPVDHALAALGQRRQVVLSAASFLFVPDIVSRSELVALVPERLVKGRATGLRVMDPPFQVQGFEMCMVWHERNHGHAGQRWLREAVLAEVGGGTSG